MVFVNHRSVIAEVASLLSRRRRKTKEARRALHGFARARVGGRGLRLSVLWILFPSSFKRFRNRAVLFVSYPGGIGTFVTGFICGGIVHDGKLCKFW